MCEEIPYGPDRKPWKDTVSAVAIDGIRFKITPPSQDPLKLYSFPKSEKGITPSFYQVPSEGLSRENCHQAQEETVQHILQQTVNHLGYQLSLGESYVDVVSKYLETTINNVGDPFVPGTLVNAEYKMDGTKCVRPLRFSVER